MADIAFDTKMARALGWASLGIAATELLAPKFLARQMGIDEHPKLFRSLGLRELSSGVGILSQRQAGQGLANGLWSRVAGDGLDGALLAAAGGASKRKGRFAVILALVLGIVALDVIYAAKMQKDVA